MSQKNYIDVDFTEVKEKPEKQENKDITICADPVSTFFNGKHIDFFCERV